VCDKQEEHKTTHATQRKNVKKKGKRWEGARKFSKTRTEKHSGRVTATNVDNQKLFVE